jgi:tetratricopeptide (TPR) repeat protein
VDLDARPTHEHAPPVPEIPHLAHDAPHAPAAVHASAQDPFGRALIALIVVTTFLGAFVAVMHSYSMSRANHAGLEAQTYGAKMAEESLRRQEDGHAKLEWAARAEVTRTQIINLRHRKILRELGLLPAAAGGRADDVDDEIGRLERLAAHLDRVSGIEPGGPDAPGRDPGFPARFLVGKIKTVHTRARLVAMQDAFNDLNVAWRIRAGWYTACLTAYAVAVYLFSLALMLNPAGGISLPWRRAAAGDAAGARPVRADAPREPPAASEESGAGEPRQGSPDPPVPPHRAAARPPAALLFTGIALALVTTATAGAISAVATSPREKRAVAAAERAAEKYADGEEASALASTPLEYAQAVLHLRQALEDRPNLVYGYAALARALFLQGSPQAEERFVSMTDPTALRHARESAAGAWRRGFRRADFLISVGWDTFLAALDAPETERRRLAEESIRLTLAAAERDPDESITHSNLGLAALFLGREAESDRHYAEAVRRAQYARAGATVPRTASDLRDRVISDLTDLELLRAFAPHLSEAIDARKAWIVGKAWPGAPEPYGSRDRRIPNLQMAVSSTAATWDAGTVHLNPREDTVVGVWYRHREYRPGTWVWHALPALSGPVTVAADGTLQRTRSYTPTPYRCLERGTYRVELYVNGRLAGERQAAVDLPALDHREFTDMSLRMCYPREWRPSPQTAPGIAGGFISVDGTAGAHLFRFRYPGDEAQAREAADAFVGWALHRLGLPSPRAVVATEGGPFLGAGFRLIYTRDAVYAYGGGRARVGVGVSNLGTVVVGIVHGPGGFADAPLAQGVFQSFR